MSFKKDKFPTIVFVAASSIAVIVLFFVYIIFTFNWGYLKYSKMEVNDRTGNDDFYFVNRGDSDDPYITKKPRLKDMLAGPIISSVDPGIGDEKAFVYIVEYSDFECSYCANQEQVLKKVLQKYKDKVRLIWKDYPDSDFTTASYSAAIAARCAGEQGKFWPYHDFLYKDNKNLNQDTYKRIAELLQLDMGTFTTCLDSPKIKRRIDNNIKEAEALGITGIPFIYINKQEVMGEISEKELERMINIQLDRLNK